MKKQYLKISIFEYWNLTVMFHDEIAVELTLK